MLISNQLCSFSSFIGCAFWGLLEEQTGALQPKLLCFDIYGTFMEVPLRSRDRINAQSLLSHLVWLSGTKEQQALCQGQRCADPVAKANSPPPLAVTLPFWYFASLTHSFPATESQVPAVFPDPHGKGISSACGFKPSALQPPCSLFAFLHHLSIISLFSPFPIIVVREGKETLQKWKISLLYHKDELCNHFPLSKELKDNKSPN